MTKEDLQEDIELEDDVLRNTIENKIYSVYVIYNPVDSFPIYVGKTRKKVALRFWEHIKEVYFYDKKNFVSYKCRKLDKLMRKGIFPCFYTVYKNLSRNQASELEIYWIAKFKNLGFELSNMTPGGDGGDCYSDLPKEIKLKLSKERSNYLKERWKNDIKFRKCISASNRENGLKNSTNLEVKAKMMDTLKKTFSNPELRKRLSIASKKQWEDIEFRKKMVKLLRDIVKDPNVIKCKSEFTRNQWKNLKFRENQTFHNRKNAGKAAHIRWHSNRGIVKEFCFYCRN